MTLATIGYTVASVAFLALTLLLLTGSRAGPLRPRLTVAAALTLFWAAALAIDAHTQRVPFLLIYELEVARDTGWLLLLLHLCGPRLPRSLVWITRLACGGALVAGLALPLLQHTGLHVGEPGTLLMRAGLVFALLGLVLVEQAVRGASPSVRNGVRYLAIGIGGQFAYDLFLYSQAELLNGISAAAWSLRGFFYTLAAPAIAIATNKNREWNVDLFVSRHVVFYSTALTAVGAYLLLMAVGGYYVRLYGGNWGEIAEIVFITGAMAVLASLVASEMLRRRLSVFINKHFYRNKYDYRIEWLRFIKTLSSTDEGGVRQTALRAIAQIFSSPGGVLFWLDDAGKAFVPVATWPFGADALATVTGLAAEHGLARFLTAREWIIDVKEYRRAPETYANVELPAWIHANGAIRIISPIFELDRMMGFVVLYEPPPPFELTFEDRDLLKTVGRHVATQLAQHDADRKLAESQQFEAYNRLTAFMMHDLKNCVAQLKLLVANASRHRQNPAFIDDAISTTANAVERMTRLIDQLNSPGVGAAPREVVLDELAATAVKRCSNREPVPTIALESTQLRVEADPDRLTAIIEHVIRNAQDATPAGGTVAVLLASRDSTVTLAVTDTGEGMDTEFVRDRLFRPFESTKGSKGMGIGAYQTREYVRLLGGEVEVQSSSGSGTRFAITLPLAKGRKCQPTPASQQ